jgi:hypothetical protein
MRIANLVALGPAEVAKPRHFSTIAWFAHAPRRNPFQNNSCTPGVEISPTPNLLGGLMEIEASITNMLDSQVCGKVT